MMTEQMRLIHCTIIAKEISWKTHIRLGALLRQTRYVKRMMMATQKEEMAA
jgi:hypothetical protein